MNKALLFCGAVLGSLLVCHASTIAKWTFESPNAPSTVMGTTINGLLPAIGSGEASALHANPATVYSAQLGNGSANSLSATYWSVGDYWQFHTSTLGYNHIQLSWDQCAADNGPTNFSLFVSIDGQNFTTALGYYQVYRNSNVVPGGGGGTWNATTYLPNYTRTLDLGFFSGLDNATDVYFRLADNVPGSTYGRVDNFTVTGMVIPEPNLVVLAAVPVLLLGFWTRRPRRQR